MASGFDLEALKRSYHRYPGVKAILDYTANRKNNSSELTADRFEAVLRKDGIELSRNEIISGFKELALLGFGEFVVGRRGQPTRFVWRVQMIEAGKAARGEAVSIPYLKMEDEAGEVAVSGPFRPDTIRHQFILRPDFTVAIDLPKDFSRGEASRLAEFVRTLPFDGGTQ